MYNDGSDIVLIHPSFKDNTYMIVNPTAEIRSTLVLKQWDEPIDQPDFNFRFVFWDKPEDILLYTHQVYYVLMVNPIDQFHFRKFFTPDSDYFVYPSQIAHFYFSIEKCYFIVSAFGGLFAVIPEHPKHMIYIEHLRPVIFVHPYDKPNELYTIEQVDAKFN